MTMYDLKNIQLVWDGFTLEGLSTEGFNVAQSQPSVKGYWGIFGENFFCPNKLRQWIISANFFSNSIYLRLLEQDNLSRKSSTLIVRDLNLGIIDVFTNCRIIFCQDRINEAKMSVQWLAPIRNGK